MERTDNRSFKDSVVLSGNRLWTKIRPDMIFYLIMLLLFGCTIWWILHAGGISQYKKASSSVAMTEVLKESLFRALRSPLAVLLLQVTVILLFTKGMGYLMSVIGQPMVIGEIIAGILLGPSLLGSISTSVSNFIFPVSSLGHLQMLSQLGLVLFMFVLGLEFDIAYLRNKVRRAVVISHSSIIISLILGMTLSVLLYDHFAVKGTSLISFALFIAISMSITAFPVLARILKERNLTQTGLGMMAITCAALDDITAWSLLAIAIVIARAGTMQDCLFTLALSGGYVLLMFLVIGPFLKRLFASSVRSGGLSGSTMSAAFILLLFSCLLTELLGIHALFGAFIAGVVMPRDEQFRKGLVDKIELVSVTLLLPLFFVFSGLRTRIGSLNDGYLWLVCLGVVLSAIAGKLGGTSVAARLSGLSRKESLSLGVLMNARGLMELIVLNIGYELGILSPVVFTMMVIMALVTTFMTTPLLDLISKL